MVQNTPSSVESKLRTGSSKTKGLRRVKPEFSLSPLAAEGPLFNHPPGTTDLRISTCTSANSFPFFRHKLRAVKSDKLK